MIAQIHMTIDKISTCQTNIRLRLETFLTRTLTSSVQIDSVTPGDPLCSHQPYRKMYPELHLEFWIQGPYFHNGHYKSHGDLRLRVEMEAYP